VVGGFKVLPDRTRKTEVNKGKRKDLVGREEVKKRAIVLPSAPD